MKDDALAYLLIGHDATRETPEAYLRRLGILLHPDRKPRHIAGRPAQLLSLDNAPVALDQFEARPITPVVGRRRRPSRRKKKTPER